MYAYWAPFDRWALTGESRGRILVVRPATAARKVVGWGIKCPSYSWKWCSVTQSWGKAHLVQQHHLLEHAAVKLRLWPVQGGDIRRRVVGSKLHAQALSVARFSVTVLGLAVWTFPTWYASGQEFELRPYNPGNDLVESGYPMHHAETMK